MTDKDADLSAAPALFEWDCATIPARTIHDAPTLFGLEEIPIRPTSQGDEKQQQLKDLGSTK